MRQYIRHPSRMPIEFQVDQTVPKQALCHDMQQSCGLCFQSDQIVPEGSKIRVSIPLLHSKPAAVAGEESLPEAPGFVADGRVAWCRAEAGGFTVAVRFDNGANRYLLRMVEQVCHIESYREQVRALQGRVLSSDEAAFEWVERYSAEFPR